MRSNTTESVEECKPGAASDMLDERTLFWIKEQRSNKQPTALQLEGPPISLRIPLCIRVKQGVIKMKQPKSNHHEPDYLLALGDESTISSDASDAVDELKIERIIAVQRDTLKNWDDRLRRINTSEIENGSRWFQARPGLEDETEERYLVKWADLSYLHCSWETKSDLEDQVPNAKISFTMFSRSSHDGYLFNTDERADGEFFDPGFRQVERILGISDDHCGTDRRVEKNDDKMKHSSWRQLLVKWWNLPYSSSTYEFEKDLIKHDIEYENQLKEFLARNQKPTKTSIIKGLSDHNQIKSRCCRLLGDNSTRIHENIKSFIEKLQLYPFPNDGKLRDYQAEGVTWLMANYINARNSILADEMGLGKTIQTTIFISMLNTMLTIRGPFLIIAPLSTLQHWRREFASWTNLNTIVYHGSSKDREYIREWDFAYEVDRPPYLSMNASFLANCHERSSPKWQRTWMVQVVLTTPEVLCSDDAAELAVLEWEALIVDEAHRLKNHSSKFATSVRDERFTFKHMVLLTGTPIQNNMTELWTLMNLIDSRRFSDCQQFINDYGDLKTQEKVDGLHETIRPYILRRLKEDVETSVPLKEETLIEVELTMLQKQYYRALYERNIPFLLRNCNKALDVGPSLNNIAMQLRKCCNHPFLLEGVERKTRDSLGTQLIDCKSEADFLVQASGKLVLLDKLLPKLKEGGHRVLIFSQFKIMLDIIEDYLRLRSFKAERIDGSITGRERQKAIDRFQAQGSMESSFIMLLTTRAGGVGINLTAADTVIIYDSDFNPQNDLQAQARCHRIGQTKTVKVYRLLTRKSYEMQMFHMSSLKMGLDQAVLQGLESGNGKILQKIDIERLLRCGAYDIFHESDSSDRESHEFMEEDIDTILERRSKLVIHDISDIASATVGRSTFSKTAFKTKRNAASVNSQGQHYHDDIDIDDPDFWKKILGNHLPDENEDMIISIKRPRRPVDYTQQIHFESDSSLLGDYTDDD